MSFQRISTEQPSPPSITSYVTHVLQTFLSFCFPIKKMDRVIELNGRRLSIVRQIGEGGIVPLKVQW
jgi:hypothetical protein